MPSHSRKSRRLHGTDPLTAEVCFGCVPSKHIEKQTVRRVEPREVQAIENVYEFFTNSKLVSLAVLLPPYTLLNARYKSSRQ